MPSFAQQPETVGTTGRGRVFGVGQKVAHIVKGFRRQAKPLPHLMLFGLKPASGRLVNGKQVAVFDIQDDDPNLVPHPCPLGCLKDGLNQEHRITRLGRQARNARDVDMSALRSKHITQVKIDNRLRSVGHAN